MPAGAHYREPWPLSPCLRNCSPIIPRPPKEWEGNGAETSLATSRCLVFRIQAGDPGPVCGSIGHDATRIASKFVTC